MKALDLRGQQFGRLTALTLSSKKTNSRGLIWECLCQCGTFCNISATHLVSGHTQSCGCLHIERMTTHGQSGKMTPTYSSWQNMKARCNNPNFTAYKDYGGRGIKVCQRWYKFENFFEDMGKKPRRLTIERINNEKGYCLQNCKWATRKEQSNNQRDQINQIWFFGFNLNTGEWDESNNQTEFATKHNLCRSSITLCLSGKYRQHKNWIFERLIPGEKYANG